MADQLRMLNSGFSSFLPNLMFPPAAQGKIKAHADEDNRYPKIQRAKVESQRVIKSLEELFRALRGNNCRDADEQNNDNCRNEYLPFRSEIVVLDRLGL